MSVSGWIGGAQVTPSQAFAPTDVAGLMLWLAADRIGGLSDGDPVGAWADLSGHANDASQATASKKPTYRAGVAHGRPVVRFDGADDYLAIADNAGLRLAGGMTCIAVLSLTTWADNVHNTLLCKGPHASGLNYLFGKYNANNPLKFTYNDGSFRDVRESTNWNGSNGQVYVVSWVVDHDAHTVDFVVDGVVKSSVADANNLAYPSGSTVEARVGINGSGSEALHGDVAELLLYDNRLTSGQRKLVERYLGPKWGISVA